MKHILQEDMQTAELSSGAPSWWNWFWNEPVVDPHCRKIVDMGSVSVLYTQEKVYEEIPAMAALFVFTCLLFAVRAVLNRVFLVLGRRWCVQEKELSKFCECMFYGVYYVFAMSCSLYILYRDGWWISERSRIWIDWPLQPFSRAFRAYYILELAFYVHAFVYLFLFEQRRKDFREMILHHAVTIGLIGLSWWQRYIRIGLVVLILHNWADIFLYFTKVVVYVTHRRGVWKEVCFAVFAANFVYSRLYLFPTVVLPSGFFDAVRFSILTDVAPIAVCNVLLWCLQILHVFWFSLIIRMLTKMLRGTLKTDIRSDDEEEDADATPVKPRPIVPCESSAPALPGIVKAKEKTAAAARQPVEGRCKDALPQRRRPDRRQPGP